MLQCVCDEFLFRVLSVSCQDVSESMSVFAFVLFQASLLVPFMFAEVIGRDIQRIPVL